MQIGIMLYFQGLLLLLSLGAIAYSLLCLYGAYEFPRPSTVSGFTPPVTVLKPVHGVDEEAYENFSSFCRQDYPHYQIIFGVLDPNDPVRPIIDQLTHDFSTHHIQLVVNPHRHGANLKVSNLYNMLPAAAHEWLVITDSDIRVTPDYLRQVVPLLQDEAVGLVTCPYRGTRPRSLAAVLEALYMSCDFMPSVLVARRLQAMHFAFGSTLALRCSVLDTIGGFESLADYVADDRELGYRVAQAGYAVCLAPYVVHSVLGKVSFGAMFQRRLRWARTNRVCAPKGWAGAFLMHGTALALLLLLASAFSRLGWVVFGMTLAMRLLTTFLIAGRYVGDDNLPCFFWLLPLNDGLGLLIWALSWLGSTITWRGTTLRLLRGAKCCRCE
jgi:ceramide glucosyltransferase